MRAWWYGRGSLAGLLSAGESAVELAIRGSGMAEMFILSPCGQGKGGAWAAVGDR